MAHQTKIRIKIGTDGVVEEQVEGVKGNQCAIITSPIEMALGPVIKRENTSDFKRTNERLQNLEEEDWRDYGQSPSRSDRKRDQPREKGQGLFI